MSLHKEDGCVASQYSDQMVCSRCALQWDTNDSHPPRCGKQVKQARVGLNEAGSPVPPMDMLALRGTAYTLVGELDTYRKADRDPYPLILACLRKTFNQGRGRP